MGLIKYTSRTAEALRKLERVSTMQKMKTSSAEPLSANKFIAAQDVKKVNNFNLIYNSQEGDFSVGLWQNPLDNDKYYLLINLDLSIAGRVYFKDQVLLPRALFLSFDNIPAVPSLEISYVLDIGPDGNPDGFLNGRFEFGSQSMWRKPGTFVEHICNLEYIYDEHGNPTHRVIASSRLIGPIFVTGVW